jgi:PAS domain S-box-containing protein
VHEDRSDFAERFSDSNNSVDAQDSLRLALEAAEIGTWDWHIHSGRVAWTTRTYELFGLQPSGVERSYDLFLRQVHAEDRPAVCEWLARALVERHLTAHEFRIDRPDGSVRWIRSRGRAMPDDFGQVVRMVGVVADITEEKGRASAALPAPSAHVNGSFSARQVAHILGVAEATVKRITAAGGMQFLRSSRKNSRRFASEDVLDYLRRGTTSPDGFDSAVRAQDMNGCLVYLLEQLMAGTAFEALLDGPAERAARVAPRSFAADLLARMPFLVEERRRHAFPVLLVQAGNPQALEGELITCALRAQGLEVLRPAGAPEPGELAELVRRVRARVVVLTIAPGPPWAEAGGLAAASAIAAAGGAKVCLRCEAGVRVPRGVNRFSSMVQLGSILRGS